MKEGWFLVGIGLACLAAWGGELVLAERGRAPEYAIVRAADASASVKYAAEELRDFTERMTGVRLPIVTGAGTVVASTEKMPRLDAAFAGTAKVTGESAVFDVTIDPEAGTVTGALVAPNATLELPANATVNVTFTSKPIHGGSWTLVDVGTAAPQDLSWTVNASVAGMSVVKSVSPERVAIEALPSGTIILFR